MENVIASISCFRTFVPVYRTHFLNSLPSRTGDQGLNPKYQFANPQLYRNTKFKCSKRDVEERVFGICASNSGFMHYVFTWTVISISTGAS